MRAVAQTQLEAATELYKQAAQVLPMPAKLLVQHSYVDFSSVDVQSHPGWAPDLPAYTSSGCIGVSMLGGAKLDGPGLKFVPPGWASHLPSI